MRDFIERVRKHLDADLRHRSFTFDCGAYRRVLANGVVHGVAFDNRGRDPRYVQIVLFVNVRLLDGQAAGGHLIRYFTGGSISELPRKLACETATQLTSVLARLSEHFDPLIEPFFATANSCAAIARALSQQPSLDFYRAQLYSLDGDSISASAECASYLKRLTETFGDAHPDVLEAAKLVQLLVNKDGDTERPS